MTTAWGNFGNWLNSSQGWIFYWLVAATILVMVYNLGVLFFSHERKRILRNLVSFFVFGIPWLVFVFALSLMG